MSVFEDRRANGSDLLGAVIDTTVDGMVVTDRAGLIKVFNPAAETLFGYSAEEVIGQNISRLMGPGDREGHDGHMLNYAQTGVRRIVGIGREVEGQRKDGTIFPMSLAVGEIKAGSDFAFVGIIRDVTDEKRSTAALIEARLKAELANDAKSQFLSRMSHELRTPMNAVLGFAQLLRMTEFDTLPREKWIDYLDSIIGPAEHLTKLIDDILDLSCVEIGAVKLVHEDVSLADCIVAALTITQPVARRAGILVFKRSFGREAMPIVVGDPLRLRQCIVNLVSNAIKYSRPEGRVLVEWAEADGVTGLVRLTVEDFGIGIPPERMGDLFKPFTRLHAALDHVEGAGIGLAMTRQLIEAMGGQVSAESEPGRGSRFHLDIPGAKGPARSVANRAAYRLPSWPAADGKRRKVVLYIEDNPSHVHLMESLLNAIPGVDLHIATSAETGLELAAAGAVRAIILDINLPGMGGFEALERLRAMRETADVPVIGLSARAAAADIERASALGFYRYLTKPVNVPELMDTLRALL